jgi:hypothetical protein
MHQKRSERTRHDTTTVDTRHHIARDDTLKPKKQRAPKEFKSNELRAPMSAAAPQS